MADSSKPKEPKVWAELTDSEDENDSNSADRNSGNDQEREGNEEDKKVESAGPGQERRPYVEKKTGQSKEDMLKEIETYDPRKKIRFNIVNIHYEATEEDIREFYKDINIIRIIPNKFTKGIFDIQVATKEDAIKFLDKGSGKIKGRPFYVRLSYVNTWEPPREPKSANYPQKHHHKPRGGYNSQEGEDSPTGQRRYKKKKSHFNPEAEQPEYASPYVKKKPNQIMTVYSVKTADMQSEETKEELKEGQFTQSDSKFKVPNSPIKFYNARKHREKEDGNTPSAKDEYTPSSNMEQSDRTPVSTSQPNSSTNIPFEPKGEETPEANNNRDRPPKGYKKDQQLYKPPPRRTDQQKGGFRPVYVEKNGGGSGDNSSNYNSPDLTPKIRSQEDLREPYKPDSRENFTANKSQHYYKKKYDKPYEQRYDKDYDNRRDNYYDKGQNPKYQKKKYEEKTSYSYVPKTETPDKLNEQNKAGGSAGKEDPNKQPPPLSLSDKKKSMEQPKPQNTKTANIFQVLQPK
jgi:hypothetical protein